MIRNNVESRGYGKVSKRKKGGRKNEKERKKIKVGKKIKDNGTIEKRKSKQGTMRKGRDMES